ncbi:hypothetical protein C2S52_022400 [Perilla frutescens var. hirtella]|nr:hypothetical protein C2S52_022400 [Perilla frutescens var. hirtella]
MGKTRKNDKSDGIEIISIGKPYNGAWDKKYWSSSRGKDRHPYPVGYKSVRTQNGITYTMEILEGLKGPSFKISSTDGKSCSGDTPEIAWESFQKKGSSKSLPAKRFSCKIDAVEFFGFKNTFVQRLLRELAANVGGPAEQSLLTSNFSDGAPETDCQLQGKPSDPDPDLLTYSFKSHAKGKRSRNDQGVSHRRLNGARFKQLQQEECTKNVSSPTSKQRDQSNSRSCDLSISAVVNEVPGICYSPGISGPEKCVPIAEGSVKLNSSDIVDHLNIGESLSEGKKLKSSMNHIELNNLHKQQESSGRSSYDVVQLNIISEDRDGTTYVQHDIPVSSNADLCVADTLDPFGDSSSVSSQIKDVHVNSTEKDEIINDVEKSEVLAADSLPEDEMVKDSYNTNSEKCDTDSVGDEIAKSMMTVLLPRAVPLIKTFSRKKKKTEKSTNTQRSHENNDMPSNSMNDSTIARGKAEHSNLQRKNEEACIPCPGRDSAVCTSGNLDSVVPDSFDNYSPQELLPHADATHSDQLSCALYCPAQLPINGDAEANQLLCHSGSSKHGTGTAGLTPMAVADTVSPLNEFSASSKRTEHDNCSIDDISYACASTKNITSTSASILGRSFSDIFIREKAEDQSGMMNSTDCDDSSSNLLIPTTSCCSLTGDIKMDDGLRSNIKHKLKLNSKLQGQLGFFACYIHPMPISMVQLIVKDNEIFTCVKCGYSEHKDDTLFVYKVSKKGEKMGCPSLVGHAPITLQTSKNMVGRDIASERSLFQLTPDGGSLVLLNSIKIPHCREGKLHCMCPACTSDGFDKNAVKIMRLNMGYASLVTRLKTTQGVRCLLVCESSFLLASEEGGKLKLWIMNSGWSALKEDWYLPTVDCMLPFIVELKIVPNSAVLVIGHNGLGEFGIWDINKRNLVSRFSSTGMSVLECVPVSIFRWQTKGEYNKTDALVAEIMDATKMWFSGRSDNHVFSPDDKDIASWVLISTTSDPDYEYDQSSEQEEANVGGYWRLALLVNNMVITGSIVDGGGAAAAATSIGHGIMGRCDGQVYMWELSTGKKLGNLHTFKGSKVSCIATDTSNSGALAIASEGQLLVYLPS